MFVVLVCGYAAFLEYTGKALDYQADSLAPSWFMFQPAVIISLISDGGPIGTLTAVAVNILHSCFFAALVFSGGTLGFAKYFTPRNQTKAPEASTTQPAPGLYPCAIEGSVMMISIPGGTDPATGQATQGIVDTDPFTQIFLRVDRKPIVTKRPPSTPIEKLEVALYELLAAHPTVPASVGHHHADANLYEHSLSIANAVVGYFRERGITEPLARVAGLAHDVDKLLAYQEKSPGNWVKRKDATHHNTFSAFVVAQQPEFALLDQDDKHVLTIALRYYHHPDKLPEHTHERVERLVSAIRHADGNVIRAEKSSGVESAREANSTSGLLDAALEKMFSTANINDIHSTGLSWGWTKEALEFVVMPMSRLIESIGAFLPGELARQLQLGVETRRFDHPSIPVLLDALNRNSLLITEHKDMVSSTGLFDVKISTKPWRSCVLLSKDRLEEIVPTAVPKWGNTSFTVRVVRATVDKRQAEDVEDTEG
ncbi:HD domain-containing protein [Pseudomonas sp. NCHU5208]|uniref:HD domain-containing protein n=1 Tax=unclassified Pseudomonas TaxID=196821 RepID=UPI003F9B4016